MVSARRDKMKEKAKEYLQFMNEKIYSQLSYAEAKHAVLSGLVGAALFALIGVIIDIGDLGLCWLQIILGVMAASMVATLIVSLASFYPFNKTLNPNRKYNLFFYGDLAKICNGAEYIEKIDDIEDGVVQLAEQNILLSKIIMRKHNMFVIALNLLFASIFLPYYLGLIVFVLIRQIKKLKNRSKNRNLEREF